MGFFCPNCHSIAGPLDARCPSCGASLAGVRESSQTSLEEASATKRPEVVAVEGAPYMPYKPRGCQMEAIEDMRRALDAGRHFVMESGTGTGKTVTALAACLEHASRTGKTVVYLTRTNSQGDQVMKELRAISGLRPVSGLALTGRSKSCPLYRGMKGFEDVPPGVLSAMCDDAKRRCKTGSPGACAYYEGLEALLPEVERFAGRELPTADEFDAFCVRRGVCPYEARKSIMAGCDVVTAPYVHVLDPDIRASLLANLGCEGNPRAVLPVIDEAHNFIDAARDAESFTLGRALIDDAVDECTTFRSPPTVGDGIDLRSLLTFFKACIRGVATELLGMGGEAARIEGPVIEERIMRKYGMSMASLESALEDAIDVGSQKTRALLDAGENRVSHIEQAATLMRRWCGTSGKRYVRSVRADSDGEYLTAACIDPSEVSVFLNSVGGAVHMSGTLQPMDQYARVLRLSDACTFRRYPSPFPPENRLVVYSPDLTTRWQDLKNDPGMKGRLERTVADLCNAVRKNTLVFFTSYGSMESMRPYLEEHVDRRTYWERPRDQRANSAALSAFRSRRDGVLFCVMGGKFAEGIDYPGEELCFAVIVGIPYPPPSLEQKGMEAMYDDRYGPGKGFAYCSAVPAQRKIRQAVGRLIRTETDRGMAVILDRRASRFAKELDARPSSDPAGEAAAFFRRGAQPSCPA